MFAGVQCLRLQVCGERIPTYLYLGMGLLDNRIHRIRDLTLAALVEVNNSRQVEPTLTQKSPSRARGIQNIRPGKTTLFPLPQILSEPSREAGILPGKVSSHLLQGLLHGHRLGVNCLLSFIAGVHPRHPPEQ